MIWPLWCVPSFAWSPLAPAPLDGSTLGAVGFARLAVREDAVWMGALSDTWSVRVLDRLAARGYPVSSPDVVFGGSSAVARYVLGGTVYDLDVTEVDELRGLTVAVDWELRDARSDRPVYRTTTRGFADADLDEPGLALIDAATDQLMARPAFVAALAWRGAGSPMSPATLRRCELPAGTLPRDLPAVLDAVVAIETDRGAGAGVVVSPDGYVLTAHHVTSGPGAHVVRPGADPIPLQVVRASPGSDIALARMATGATPCRPLGEGAPLGSPVWLAGNPLGQGLAVSSGIVSAHRRVEDVDLLQTDVSTSPGHSGGPLLDAAGAVVGILSWKVVGDDVDGLAFAVPTSQVLSSLSLTLGDISDIPAEPESRRDEVLDPADPPFAQLPRGTVCVYRSRGELGTSMVAFGGVAVVTTAPSRYLVRVGYGDEVPLDHAEYICRDVPAGPVPLRVSGGPGLTIDVAAGATSAVLVVPPSALVQKTRLVELKPKAFWRMQPRLMEADVH